MGWGVGLKRRTEKWLTVFFPSGGRHYQKALLADRDHKPSWAPPVFMTGVCVYGGGESRSVLGTGLKSIVAPAVFHCHPLSLPVTLLHPISSNQASVSRLSVLFWSCSQPCWDTWIFFLIMVSFVAYFSCCSHPLYHVPSLSLVSVLLVFPSVFESHVGVWNSSQERIYIYFCSYDFLKQIRWN